MRTHYLYICTQNMSFFFCLGGGGLRNLRDAKGYNINFNISSQLFNRVCVRALSCAFYDIRRRPSSQTPFVFVARTLVHCPLRLTFAPGARVGAPLRVCPVRLVINKYRNRIVSASIPIIVVALSQHGIARIVRSIVAPLRRIASATQRARRSIVGSRWLCLVYDLTLVTRVHALEHESCVPAPGLVGADRARMPPMNSQFVSRINAWHGERCVSLAEHRLEHAEGGQLSSSV